MAILVTVYPIGGFFRQGKGFGRLIFASPGFFYEILTTKTMTADEIIDYYFANDYC